VFAFDSVTVPVVDFVNAPAPPSIALTVPLCTPYDAPVNTPVVPVIVPLESVTAPTVSLYAPTFNTPPDTVTGPLESALAMPYDSVPALTVVVPVYVFAPDRVIVPVPVLVRLLDGDPSPLLMTPENVVEALLPPTVKVSAPPYTLSPIFAVPAPARDPIVSFPEPYT
jgi:hypothetical protein